MSQNLQNVVKFQKIQLENLVDFEKCCKTHIFLKKQAPVPAALAAGLKLEEYLLT